MDYSETSHGKGPTDGLGGTVNRMAIRKIKSQKAICKGHQNFPGILN